jgi:hypothetical protein
MRNKELSVHPYTMSHSMRKRRHWDEFFFVNISHVIKFLLWKILIVSG